MAKSRLRKHYLALRAQISPDDAARKSLAVARAVLSLPDYRSARTVMAYSALPGEVEAGAIISAALGEGKRVCLPKVRRPPRHLRQELVACLVDDYPGDLEPGAFGVLEVPDGREMVIPPAEIDLMLIPGLAFDLCGIRLGYGAGYYDRFLADPAVRATTVGVCFMVQLAQILPRAPHDRKVQYVVTEEGVQPCLI